MKLSPLPRIILGGMGIGVSNWRLSNAVAKTGQMGVVSGTAMDMILARRLQLGDEGGHMRWALEALPIPGVAQRILDSYYIPGGKAAGKPFRSTPMPGEKLSQAHVELLVAANFVEVYLAKEGHEGPVGINFLEKIQTPTLPSLYGAMLANMVAIPFADKLKVRAAEEEMIKSMALDAVLAIQAGQNPRVIEGMLRTYLPEGSRASDEES